MKLIPLAENQTIIEINGKEIFFSYQTPVALFIPGQGFIKTEQKFSGSSSRHINNFKSRFSDKVTVSQWTQEAIDTFVSKIKLV